MKGISNIIIPMMKLNQRNLKSVLNSESKLAVWLVKHYKLIDQLENGSIEFFTHSGTLTLQFSKLMGTLLGSKVRFDMAHGKTFVCSGDTVIMSDLDVNILTTCLEAILLEYLRLFNKGNPITEQIPKILKLVRSNQIKLAIDIMASINGNDS